MKGQIDSSEILKEIAWAPAYMVSNRGNVYRIIFENDEPTIRVRKPYLAKVGYYIITFQDERRRSMPRYIHRLVAEAFLPPRSENHEVRHLDGNRTNNCAENLAWGTRLQNVADTIRHGRIIRGSASKMAVLGEADIPVVRWLLARECVPQAIADCFNVSRSTIAAIQHGHAWTHVKQLMEREVPVAEDQYHPEFVCGEELL